MKTTSQNQAFKALTFNDLQNDAYLAEALDFIYSEGTNQDQPMNTFIQVGTFRSDHHKEELLKQTWLEREK